MAMRGIVRKFTPSGSMESIRGATRRFSDGKGKILSEEERAAENVYIKKMERERLEKLKQKLEKEKGSAKTTDDAVNKDGSKS